MKKILFKRTLPIVTCLLLTVFAFPVINPSSVYAVTSSGLNVTTSLTKEQLVDAIVGPGISVSNIQYAGTGLSSGIFTGGTDILGYETGLILSTGHADGVIGPHDGMNVDFSNSLPGDPDLQAILAANGGGTSCDATSLSFDFIPQGDTVIFQYVLSSSEYQEFEDFGDVFGLLVNNKNIAIIPDTNPQVPVSVKTINENKNAEYYISNIDGHLNTRMDGLTKVMTAACKVNAGVVNHIKLAVSDMNDFNGDTNIFIQAGSLKNIYSGVPTNVTASAGDQQAIISWNPVDSADSYKVSQSTDLKGPYTKIAEGLTDTSYTAKGLIDNTTYYFVVQATKNGIDGDNSDITSAVPKAPLMTTPSNLTAVPGHKLVTLNWKAADNAKSYKIYQSEKKGGPYTLIAQDVKDVTYTVKNLGNQVTYYFVVKASNNGGDTDNSNEAAALTLAVPQPPAHFTSSAGDKQVILSWNSADDADSYTILEASVPGGPYTQVAAGITGTSYTVTGLANELAHYFIIRAVNASGSSVNSAEIKVVPKSSAQLPQTGTALDFTSMSAAGLIFIVFGLILLNKKSIIGKCKK